MSLVDGGAGTLYYALDCLRLILAASFVVLLGKIGIIAITKGNSADSSDQGEEQHVEQGGIRPVVVKVSSIRYNFVIALLGFVSGSYLLQIAWQGQSVDSYHHS